MQQENSAISTTTAQSQENTPVNLLFKAKRAPTTHTQANEQACSPPVSCLSAKFLFPHRACIPAATSETEVLPQSHTALLPLPFLSLCS